MKDKYKSIVNTTIPKYMMKELEETLNCNYDIIIVDRSLFDRLIWVDRIVLKKQMTVDEYEEYKNEYLPLIKEKIDIIVSTYTDSLTSLKRDYNANLSLEERRFLNVENVNEYNNSLLNMKLLAEKENLNFHIFDTTNKNQRENSFDVVNVILNSMREEYIKRLNNEFSDS